MQENNVGREQEALEEKNRQLQERIKELNCLYELSRIFEDGTALESEQLQQAVELFPQGWQYPEIACARLMWESREYSTPNFRETTWSQTSDILYNRVKKGFVQICYLEERPVQDEGPFLREERRLLDTLATHLSRFLASRAAEQERRRSEELNKAILQSSPLPIFSLDLAGNVLTWNAAAKRVLGWSADEVVGKPLPIVPKGREEESAAIRQRIAMEGGFTGLEVVRQNKRGELIEVSLSTASICDAQGQVYGIVAALEDITERKRAERDLVETSENLRVTLNSIGDGVIATDIKGRVTRMNPVAESLTGWRLEEALGLQLDKVFCIVDAQSGQKAENPVHKVLSSGKIVGMANHTKLISRQGHEYQIADAGSPIRDKDGHVLGVVLVFRDVSEEYWIRKSMEESEQRFRSIVEGAPDPIFIQTEKKFAYINPAACELFGISSAYELIGTPVMDRFHHEFHQVIQERIRRLNEGRKAVHEAMEQKYIRMDGSEVWVETSGQPIEYDGKKGALVFARNITQRKKAQESLKQSEAKYRELFNSIRDAILVTDTDRNIIDCNQAFTELFGYSLEEIQGNTTLVVYHDKHEYREMGREIQKNIDDPWFLYTINYVKKNGETFPGETKVYYLKNSHSQIIGYIGMIRDISERKKAEAEKNRLEMQLRQAQKMEAIGRLAGGVAHDFNNLLTTITGNAEIGLMDLSKDEELYEIMQEIKEAGERAGNLTRQLLAFSRRQILQPEVLDLNDLIRDLKKMLRRLIGEDVQLQTHLASNLGYVEADPGQMEQVLMNLAVNARDAMPEGGTLTIETADVELDESYAHGHGHLILPGSYIRLAVSDTGTGMSQEMQNKIFDPFFTTKEKGKGTGLGLSTVYGIVKQSKGNIWVYSEQGRGTTFKIYLPRGEKKIAGPDRRPQGQEPSLHGNETVLVVEDDASVRRTAVRNLTRFGYAVLSAENAREALDICRNNSREIDLVLTDVIMPEMSGKELAKSLEEEGLGIQVVYMSGYTDNAIVHHGVLDPGVFFIQKPFSPESLARKVREALDQTTE